MGATVYLIKHVSGVFYIGSTLNMPGRKSVHLTHLRAGKHHATLLQEAYNKDTILTWETYPVSEGDRIATEQQMLDKHLGNPLLANTCTRANPGRVGVLTPLETKVKISEANSGKIRSDETKALMSSQRKGVPKSPEWSDKIAEATRVKVEVDGFVYPSATAAAAASGCTVNTVLNRARSPRPKWAGWRLV